MQTLSFNIAKCQHPPLSLSTLPSTNLDQKLIKKKVKKKEKEIDWSIWAKPEVSSSSFVAGVVHPHPHPHSTNNDRSKPRYL